MRKIFLDRRVWRNSRDNWVSFESDSHLRVTKENIYGRCVPCITTLYRQLREGKEEIELREAFDCWKVITVLRTQEECLEVLREYEETCLGNQYVKGKFGSSQPVASTKVLMFHTEDKQERDRLLEELRVCVQKVNPNARVFHQRGCANLYHDLLGDWRTWEEVKLPAHRAGLPGNVIMVTRSALTPLRESVSALPAPAADRRGIQPTCP
jgi:hypothetical protein